MSVGYILVNLLSSQLFLYRDYSVRKRSSLAREETLVKESVAAWKWLCLHRSAIYYGLRKNYSVLSFKCRRAQYSKCYLLFNVYEVEVLQGFYILIIDAVCALGVLNRFS